MPWRLQIIEDWLKEIIKRKMRLIFVFQYSIVVATKLLSRLR